jgi:hypothetical protein
MVIRRLLLETLHSKCTVQVGIAPRGTLTAPLNMCISRCYITSDSSHSTRVPHPSVRSRWCYWLHEMHLLHNGGHWKPHLWLRAICRGLVLGQKPSKLLRQHHNLGADSACLPRLQSTPPHSQAVVVSPWGCDMLGHMEGADCQCMQKRVISSTGIIWKLLRRSHRYMQLYQEKQMEVQY